jgi:hypothetical protein
VGFFFVGIDLDGVPVRAQGVQDGGQACAFMRGEINVNGTRLVIAHLLITSISVCIHARFRFSNKIPFCCLQQRIVRQGMTFAVFF